MRTRWTCLAFTLTLLLTAAAPAQARIKLITLPVRERVEIQLDHAQVTLVEEERTVPLVQGVNQVDFSWANTAINPDTIVFRVLGPVEAGELDARVLSVSYPPGEQALVWQVAATESGSVRVRISYLLGNLSKSFNYRAVADQAEKTLTFSQYLRVQNLANEEYGDSGLWMGFGQGFLKPVGINQTMEMLAARFVDVPISKTYTCNVHEHGYLDASQKKLRVPMHYVLHNDREHQLGQAALPFGKVRIFQEDGRGSTAFLGEDWGQFTPVDDQMRLFLGVAQDISVKRTIAKNERIRVGGNLYHQSVVVQYEIENFKNAPITLNLAEQLQALRAEVLGETGRPVQWEVGPETTLAGKPDPELTTYETLVFHADLPAAVQQKAQKITHKLHILFRNEW